MPDDSKSGLAPGDRFDRYVIEGLLGRGGMGEVWQAIDPKLDRRIALKILARGTDGSDAHWAEARGRMMREARAVAALNHPNVVAVFDVGMVDERPYIAMELVEGATLRAYIGDNRVSAKRRAQWLIEVARALSSAHKRGIVHRDVKPENVMVRADGALKVLDFGIARRVRVEDASITREGQLVGTLMYMAPEQLDGSAVDARADQFAWGILAIELLRGEHPWMGCETGPHVVDAILNKEAARVEGAFETAIARATAKNAADRFGSMEELLAAIDGTEPLPSLHMAVVPVTVLSSTSRPVTLDERSPLAHSTDVRVVSPRSVTVEVANAPVRRRRWPVVVVGFVATVAAGLIGVRTWQGRTVVTTAPSAAVVTIPSARVPLEEIEATSRPAVPSVATVASAPGAATVATGRVVKKGAPGAAASAGMKAKSVAAAPREEGENGAPIMDPD